MQSDCRFDTTVDTSLKYWLIWVTVCNISTSEGTRDATFLPSCFFHSVAVSAQFMLSRTAASNYRQLLTLFIFFCAFQTKASVCDSMSDFLALQRYSTRSQILSSARPRFCITLFSEDLDHPFLLSSILSRLRCHEGSWSLAVFHVQNYNLEVQYILLKLQ